MGLRAGTCGDDDDRWLVTVGKMRRSPPREKVSSGSPWKVLWVPLRCQDPRMGMVGFIRCAPLTKVSYRISAPDGHDRATAGLAAFSSASS